MINFVELDITQNEIRGQARDVATYRIFYQDYLNQITMANSSNQDLRINVNTVYNHLQYTPLESIIRLREICQLSMPKLSQVPPFSLDQSSFEIESQ